MKVFTQQAVEDRRVKLGRFKTAEFRKKATESTNNT
jgi:hypothetical protein